MPNSAMRRRRRPAGAGLAPLGGHQQRAQAGEAVGVDEPERHQLGERLLGLRGQAGRCPAAISSKNEAPWVVR